jgi:prepilin-type N-terminal cleavage/methylation domain-containing protein
MHINRSRGFTLIELLVVIAIIGILSAVVLASLNTARSKGADAAIASNLATVQTQAEIYYGGTGGNKYNVNGTSGLAAGTCTSLASTLLADTTIWNAVNGAITTNGGAAATVSKCAIANDGSSYAIAVASKVTPANWYCVDSGGYTSPSGGGSKTASGGAAGAASCN